VLYRLAAQISQQWSCFILAVSFLLVVNNSHFLLRPSIILLCDCGTKIGSKSNFRSTGTRSFDSSNEIKEQLKTPRLMSSTIKATEQLPVYDILPLFSIFCCYFSKLSGRSIETEPVKKGHYRELQNLVLSSISSLSIFGVFLPRFFGSEFIIPKAKACTVRSQNSHSLL